MKIKPHLEESFQYRLSILMKEIELTDKAIERIDDITQTVKNWAIITWAGSISIFLGNNELRKFLIFTAILPLLFWMSDVIWRRLQKRSVFRQRMISKFINSKEFEEAFQTKDFGSFYLLDPVGANHRKETEYRKALQWSTIFFYREISFFYGGLMLVSFVAGAIFLFFPNLLS